MKFQPEKLEGLSVVQGYDEQGVIINGQRYSDSVVFGTRLPPEPWSAGHASQLNSATARDLITKLPDSTEVVLIGTGQTQIFPSTDFRRVFLEERMPVEYMDTQAASRTYNILIGEGRHVVAALLVNADSSA